MCLLNALLCALVNADTVSINFTSLRIPTGTYDPERDVIVYIVDSSGAFVRTIATWGTDLDDDIPWKNVSSGSKVDAVSGATIMGTDARSLKTTWDGKDANKTNVLNGIYWLIISANSRDRNASPSRLKIKLDITGSSKTVTSADSSFSNGAGYLTDLNVVFTPSANKIHTHTFNTDHKAILLGKMPVYISNRNMKFTVSLYSLSGRCIFRKFFSVREPDKCVYVPVKDVSDGTYLYTVTTETACISNTIVMTHR
jgi:hypothetical protein